MGYYVKNRQLQSGSTGVVLPVGTTAQRPANPAAGLIRYNTDTDFLEYFNGTVFETLLTATGGAVTYTVENFPGDGTDTTFAMTQTPTAIDQIIVFVGSVYQIPTTNYTVSGADIIFTSAPPDGVTISIIHTVS
jgi:hypothetical protein